MRKTSQDGGEYPATSAVENEVKKPKGLLSELKTKKIGKRTAPNLSEESDDAVVEPLLQKSTNSAVQSAKYFAKAKAETVKEITKLFNDKKTQHASTSGFGTTESLLSEKDQADSTSNVSNIPQHNHMNTNVFHSLDNAKVNGTTKTQVLVELDGSKQSGFNPSPLIFTTAKIHTDGKPNHMEPVQMTPAPITSTVEVSVSKGGNIISNEKKVSNGASIMNISFSQPLKAETTENTTNFSTNIKAQNSISKSDNNKTTKATNKPDKTQLNYPLKTDSLSSTSKLITAPNVSIAVATNSNDTNKIMSEPSISGMPKSNIKFPLEEIKAVESSAQLPFILQTHKKEKPTIDSDSKSINKDREGKEKEVKSLIATNIQPIAIEKQTSSSTKPLERQKNITSAEDLLKTETKMASSKIPDDSNANSSLSMYTPKQSKINECKLNTDTDMSLKSSANEKSKFDSKVSVNNPANALKETSISPQIVKPSHDPLLPAVETHAITPKTITTVTDTINSNANKVQTKTTKTVSSTIDTASSSTDKTKAVPTRAPTSIAEKAISNANKTPAITATSTTTTGSSNTDKTKAIITKSQTLVAEKSSSKSNKNQAVTATSMADKASPKTDKTQIIPIKASTSFSDKASSNANKTQAVTATSVADKPSCKADKTQTLPTMAPTSFPDIASSNANKNQAITSIVATSIADKVSSSANKPQALTETLIADTANSKADKTQNIPTKASTSITDKASSNANKTQAATSADKTGSNTNKSQIVTTKAATSTRDPTSSKAKQSPASNTKPTATSIKTPCKPISVSTVTKKPTNKSPSTTPSAKIAQVTSPGSTTAKPLVGKTAQVSTSTTKPTGITSLPTVSAEHSNKTKTNEFSNKIASKSSDQTKDVKVTKA